MTTRAVVVLGIAQLVNWGVLYYAFAILVVPLERELGVPTWIVTGAFSLGLLMSALLAPAVGRWGDRDRAPLLMLAGGVAAAAVLVIWTLVPGVVSLFVVWAALGGCMAATLYEPAFVIVGRAFQEPSRRVRALAVVTLFGGLASTAALPGTAILVEAFGWRTAVRVLAVLLLATTGAAYAFVLRHIHAAPVDASIRARDVAGNRPPPSGLLVIAASFALASLASAGLGANLVPAFGERGASPAAAAAIGGVMGVMQLPGRALLMHGAFAASPARLMSISLLLLALGLAAVAAATSTPVIAAGAMVFAAGAGLTTLVRPHLIQTLFGSGSDGAVNGRLARQQQLARAAGPLAIAWLGGFVGYGTTFALLAGALAMLALAAQGVPGPGRRLFASLIPHQRLRRPLKNAGLNGRW